MDSQVSYNSLKHEFIEKLNKYLQHKNLLSLKSKWYKTSAIATALSRCNTAFTTIIKNCGGYSLQRICQLVLANKNTLALILPSYNNSSYQSSLQTLDWIIQFAEQHK